jgi:hypothetical protein
MLYTASSPDRQGGSTRLYFSPDDAAKQGHQVLRVSVYYDGLLHRVTSLGDLYRRVDPGWTAPAVYHPDGCIIVRDTIPPSLFSAESREGQTCPSTRSS